MSRIASRAASDRGRPRWPRVRRHWGPPSGTSSSGGTTSSRTTTVVPAVVIDTAPVTNANFRYFVESGGYQRPEFWSEADWECRTRSGLTHPLVWAKRNGAGLYRTLFDIVPLELVEHWPVYVSLAEACAYARWTGGRLPTEAEFHRAAYGHPDGHERSSVGTPSPLPASATDHRRASWRVREPHSLALGLGHPAAGEAGLRRRRAAPVAASPSSRR
jgi:formylglycine-generating enzyme required for sulfatase activity